MIRKLPDIPDNILKPEYLNGSNQQAKVNQDDAIAKLKKAYPNADPKLINMALAMSNKV